MVVRLRAHTRAHIVCHGETRSKWKLSGINFLAAQRSRKAYYRLPTGVVIRCIGLQDERLQWVKEYWMAEKRQERSVHEESRAYTMIKVCELVQTLFLPV